MPDAAAQPSRGSEEFSAEVRAMFDRIAGVYDRMNHVMTAGLDHRWRERAVERAELGAGDERPRRLLRHRRPRARAGPARSGPAGRVVGCDFSEPMLEMAREKAAARGDAPVEFEWADALELPYEDDSFDAVTVGFGVRNLADLDAGSPR